jgi:uncharacterized protein (DUF983 family)
MSEQFSGPEQFSRPAPRPFWQALLKGWRMRCPDCGQFALFLSFLKTNSVCEGCGLEIGNHRADDAPPYFTILLVGHILVPPILWMERWFTPSPWLQSAIFVPLTVILTVYFLPRIKGTLIGLQWSKRMTGFE